MGSPSELSLDYRPNNSYAAGLKPFGDQPDQTQKLEEFLARLEEERLKIEAFKRELPLCMQLLNNAMETYRQQLDMYHSTNHGARPVFEEFIPLKHASPATEVPEKPRAANHASSEKAGWMTSAQLWSPAEGGAAMQAAAPQEDADPSFNVSPKVALDNKQRHCGAFLPFSKERSGRARDVVPEIALAPMEKDEGEKKVADVEAARKESCGKGAHEQGKAAANAAADGGGQAAGAAQTHRKARRCWTPELHRRFVNSLQMLGGSQVATPKQIRELMKVDGLTNDEVKSHLQKYRLHTRRPIPAPPAGASATAPQLVVLGGIWVPQEYATTATAAGGSVIYGGHAAAAAHFCAAPPVQQDFYSPPLHPTPYPPPRQRDHGLAAAATAASGPAYQMKNESPESEGKGRQERSESIEDGEEEVEGDDEVEEEEEEGRQSENGSWKEGDENAVGAAEGINVNNSSAMGLMF